MMKLEFTATTEGEIKLVEEFLAKVREARAAERQSREAVMDRVYADVRRDVERKGGIFPINAQSAEDF